MTHATVHPRARTLLPTAVALVLLGAGSWGLPQAGMFLVVRQAVATPEVILSLGSHEWERLPVAAGIAAREPAASVLLTEPVTPTPANCNNCGARAAWLEGLGVPGHRVSMLAPPVTNTYTTAGAGPGSTPG
jgi:hypothetical protein